MNFPIYVIPILIVFLLIYSIIKKKNVYELFISGTKESIPFIISIFPYITAILIMNELFKISGLLDIFIKFSAPIFNIFGVPKEVINLIILKPFSGSGSLAILDELITLYGPNSYITMVACCIFGSSETIFYISAIYFVNCKNKKVTKGITISLLATFIATILCCNLLKLLY